MQREPVITTAGWSTDERPPAPPAATLAYVTLIALALLSGVIRPIVTYFGLPAAAVNADALLVPVVVGVVALSCLLSWRQQPRWVRLLTAALVLLGVAALVSWLVADTRSVVSLALAYSSVLLFPLALFLAALGARAVWRRGAVLVLHLLVLLQLGFGIYQYVVHDVAVRAPFGADLVNGTSSHNLWPAFALPAALVLAIVDSGWRRFLWPLAVVILAVYSEAKAALVVWLPAILLIGALAAVQHVWRDRASLRRRVRPEAGITGALVASTGAILLVGLWWSPSVQGTWEVFGGHTRTLEQFVVDDVDPTQEGDPATIKDAIGVLRSEVPRNPDSFLFGLGPANTVSHAAEVLARGAKSGVALPDPGPVARQLVADDADIKFSDGQSSALGLWGDLGIVGALLYVVAVALCAFGLATGRRASGRRVVLVATQLMLVAGPLAVGLLLDWSEQASVVLPIALAAMVAGRADRPSSAPASRQEQSPVAEPRHREVAALRE